MNKIEDIRNKKLIRQLDFIESEYKYTNEVVYEADKAFIESLNKILEKYPDIKKEYNKKVEVNISKKVKESINKNIESDDIEIDISVNHKIPTKIKKLYREIVKLTHSDKVVDKKLNDLYVEATNFYSNIDKIGIYKICDKLNIKYDVDKEDQELILNKINLYKNKIKFLESTFTWVWLSENDNNQKEKIILDFVRNKIKIK